MKTYTYILFFLSLAIFSGCEKILDVPPSDYISGDKAITDRRGVETALTGTYDALQLTGCYGRHMPIIPDLVADNLNWTGTTQDYGQFQNNSLLAENLIVESIWNAHYTALNRANNVIHYLPGVGDMTAAEKDNVVGQLLFIRALCHFNLVRLFGPVPLKTAPTLEVTEQVNVPRVPVDQVYQQIISDLEEARNKINVTNPGFATRGGATALLAKVHLTLGNYTQAKSYATETIGNFGYALAPDFSELFDEAITSESIFILLFNEQDDNRLAEYFFPTAGGGRYEVSPNPGIITAFDTNDVRKDASITGQPPYGYKYRDMVTRANNVHILRLADMYLARAEAEAYLQGTVEQIQADINMIRNRAGLDDITETDYDALLAIVETERRREFAFEGHRWFDLLRTGRAKDVKETIVSDDQLLFPVPLSEILNNTNPDMYQNNGY